jgi:hypothetical protein
MEYTKIMNKFPFDVEEAKKRFLEAQPVVTPKPVVTTPDFQSTSFISHTVQRGDTLVGLSLKYGVPVTFGGNYSLIVY